MARLRILLPLAICLVLGQALLALAGAAVKAVSPHESTTLQSRFVGRLPQLEQRLLADAEDGRLDRFPLLRAALLAGGVEREDELRHYQQRYSGLVQRLHDECDESAGPRERAEGVFDFLHREVLRGGYCLEATDLRVALDEGRYNCVSASVLFQCLAGECGLEVRGLESPRHVMTRLRLPDGELDIEATCPEWFRLEESKRPATASGATCREVSPVEMVAMIYYNRGLDLLAAKRFAAAAAANAKALRLNPTSAVAKGNLLATINNWAIDLAQSGRYAEAVELLRQGMALDPGYAAFAPNYRHVHCRWAESLRHGQPRP